MRKEHYQINPDLDQTDQTSIEVYQMLQHALDLGKLNSATADHYEYLQNRIADDLLLNGVDIDFVGGETEEDKPWWKFW